MPAKKAVGTRARRNTASTAATLPAKPTRRRKPKLPVFTPGGMPWHPAVEEWWADLWAAPMSEEYHESDIHQLHLLAALYHDFYMAESPSMRMALSAEIRHQRQAFGLTPYDRRRLEWTIEAADAAKATGTRRRAAQRTQAPPPPPADDPRSVLRVIDGKGA